MKKCPNCEKYFEPNSGKQKFCSDKCKVAFARKTAKGIIGVTTADKIPIPEKKLNEVDADVFDMLALKKRLEELRWVKEIESFCEKESITPTDLIEVYITRNKSYKHLKQLEESTKDYVSNADKLGLGKDKPLQSNWFTEYRKNKLGLNKNKA